MCMLNKRTQILFDEDMYQQLVELARLHEVPMGELVRRAVKKTYSKTVERKKKRIKTFFRKKVSIAPLRASDLVTEGRKSL